MDEPQGLTVEQKMEMSLEEIIWYEKQLHNSKGPSSLKNVVSQGTSTDQLNKNMFDRTKRLRRHTISYNRPRNCDNLVVEQQQVQCVHGCPSGFRDRKHQIPMYRKRVLKALRTLRSKSRQKFIQGPYNKGRRMFRANHIAVSVENAYHQDDSMISNDEISGANGIAVSINNDFHQSNVMIDAVNSDGTENLEMPVRNNMDFDFRRVPKFFFMGTKIVVSRHSIKNKLNHVIQNELKEMYETKGSRERYHYDMNVLVVPHTTIMSMHERFTFNG